MGVVYEAEHLAIGKLVAIKVLHPRHAQDREASSRLRHEARVAGTLGHPNICAIYDMGRLDDGSPYLVLERLHGETLAPAARARAPRAQPPTWSTSCSRCSPRWRRRTSAAWCTATSSPRTSSSPARRACARCPSCSTSASPAPTTSRTPWPTPRARTSPPGRRTTWRPSRRAATGSFDWRVDLWSAGVVLYEGLTGQRPFVAKNYNALLVDILEHAARAPSSTTTRRSRRAVTRRRAGAREATPTHRYQSALELQNALRSYKDLEEAAPRPARAHPPQRADHRRRRRDARVLAPRRDPRRRRRARVALGAYRRRRGEDPALYAEAIHDDGGLAERGPSDGDSSSPPFDERAHGEWRTVVPARAPGGRADRGPRCPCRTIDRVVARGIVKAYGSTMALRGVDATFGAAQLTLIEGANGSGKSTLLGILGTVIRPTRGHGRSTSLWARIAPRCAPPSAGCRTRRWPTPT